MPGSALARVHWLARPIVAMNARRHGAMAKPERGRVVAWLRIILNSPNLQPDNLLDRDERLKRALQAFEQDAASADEQMQRIRAQVDVMTRILQRAETAGLTDGGGVKVISKIDPSLEDDLILGGRRHRLLLNHIR